MECLSKCCKLQLSANIILTTIFFAITNAISHDQNLMLSLSPSVTGGYARIVGIQGDPEDWVAYGNLTVRQILAPHFSWRFHALAYDFAAKTLFWSESRRKSIQKLVLDGGTATEMVYTGTSTEVDGLVVDWISGNIYWSDMLYNSIKMMALNASDDTYRTVITGGLDMPQGLAVHPQQGYLFWSDWGSQPKIEASTLTGLNRRTLVNESIVQPRGLAVDAESHVLYWVDSFKDTIESVSFGGFGRRVIATAENTVFFGMAIYKQYLFVTEQTRGHLRIYDKRLGTNKHNYKLGYIPSAIIMYDGSLQEGDPSSCISYGCQQICVDDPLAGPSCFCGDEYVIADDKKSCIHDQAFVQPSHIYSIQDGICRFPANLPDMSLTNITLSSQCFLKLNRGYLALAYDSTENVLYYSENVTRSINRVRLEHKSTTEAIISGVGVVEGLAVDWMTGNLFWTDSGYKHIKVSRTTGSYQRVLVKDGIQNPYGIAVHPKRGTIYWSDNGAEPKIEWCYMDGSHRTLLADATLGVGFKPMHLFIDFQKDLLYWADAGLSSIFSYDFDRKRISLVTKQPQVQFVGISIFRDYLLWTERGARNGIHIVRLDNMDKIRQLTHQKTGIASDLISFDAQNQPSYSPAPPCSSVNGGCQQLCLTGNLASFWCSCGLGFYLDDNRKTCSSEIVSDNFILVTDAYQKQIYQLNPVRGSVQAISVATVARPVSIDYDPIHSKVYWSDIGAKVVKRADLNGRYETPVLNLPFDSVVDGIAIDYVNSLLYFTDTGRNIIGVVSLIGRGYMKTVLNESLDEPRAIVLDPIHGEMYWTDWGSVPRIEAASMDGAARRPLVILEEGSWPNGIALDIQGGQLYWCEAHFHTVETISVDGRNRRVLLKEEKAHYFGITLMGNYIYISDWNRRSMIKLPRSKNMVAESVGPASFGKMNGIHAYNSSERLVGRGICYQNTCSQLCLPVPDDKICACADGYVPDLDGETCIEFTSSATNNSKSNTSHYATQENTDASTYSNDSLLQSTQYPGINFTDDVIVGKFSESQQIIPSTMSSGAIAGIVIAILLVAVALSIVGFFLFKRYRNDLFSHGKLEEESHVDSYYRITFPEENKEEPTFDSGIY